MTFITVKPETGKVAFPRFSNMFENFFENEFPSVTQSEYFKTPALVNVQDTKDSYAIQVAAPGFKKGDFSVKVENNLLTITGEKKQETEVVEQKFKRKEFNFASFSRAFTLPKTIDVEKIAASYEDGILTVTLPKKEEAKVSPVVEIQIG
jgi:HSP20 family protein